MAFGLNPKTSGGTPQIVALAQPAVELLQRRREAFETLRDAARRPGDPAALVSARARQRLETARRLVTAWETWVFPGLGGSGHMVEPKRAWSSLLQRAGIENLRLRDLRRTLGSWQVALGTNLAVIQKTLGHADISTTMVYARLNIDPVREAMEATTAAIMAAAKPPAEGAVIPMPLPSGGG